MRRAVPLDEITAEDAPRVGGKAYGCARLRQAGFPVPDGIALGREAMSAPEAAAALGTWLARLMLIRLNQEAFEWVVIVLLVVASGLLFWQNR